MLREVLTDLANTLRDRGDIDEREAFIDAAFTSAKGGGEQIGPSKRGKGACWFDRVTTRPNFQGFVQLASITMLLKRT